MLNKPTLSSSMRAPTEPTFLDYYHLERYLFDVVGERFRSRKTLSAFDFFCIVIWKANRAKSTIARRLLAKQGKSLDDAVEDLITHIAKASNAKDRLAVLMDDWGFRLPMASAILTVLYPTEFTVYDVRVCTVLDDFRTIGNIKDPERRWYQYQHFCLAVAAAVTEPISLRDKDRWLWGKSFAEQLQHDVRRKFKNDESDT